MRIACFKSMLIFILLFFLLPLAGAENTSLHQKKVVKKTEVLSTSKNNKHKNNHKVHTAKKAVKKMPPKTTEEAGINAKYFPVTVLSQRAMQLKIGMTREEVYGLLGKPTWAERHEGEPLDWTWFNGQCNPIDVTFDNNMRVNGFDQGRQKCFEGDYSLGLPGDELLCANETIAALCDPKTSFSDEM